jgi:hypothetical protein
LCKFAESSRGGARQAGIVGKAKTAWLSISAYRLSKLAVFGAASFEGRDITLWDLGRERRKNALRRRYGPFANHPGPMLIGH